jgi:SOS-response transcriptional repressor LexA
MNVDIPAFAMEVRGRALAGVGLRDGDSVWIEPTSIAQSGDVVLARVLRGGRSELRLCRLLRRRSGRAYLATQPAGRPQTLACTTFEIIGSVTSALCRMASRRPAEDARPALRLAAARALPVGS